MTQWIHSDFYRCFLFEIRWNRRWFFFQNRYFSQRNDGLEYEAWTCQSSSVNSWCPRNYWNQKVLIKFVNLLSGQSQYCFSHNKQVRFLPVWYEEVFHHLVQRTWSIWLEETFFLPTWRLASSLGNWTWRFTAFLLHLILSYRVFNFRFIFSRRDSVMNCIDFWFDVLFVFSQGFWRFGTTFCLSPWLASTFIYLSLRPKDIFLFKCSDGCSIALDSFSGFWTE